MSLRLSGFRGVFGGNPSRGAGTEMNAVRSQPSRKSPNTPYAAQEEE
jgi:hypothetical protein